MNSEHAKKTTEELNKTHGEIYRYGGGWIVKAEKNAGNKLLSLMEQ